MEHRKYQGYRIEELKGLVSDSNNDAGLLEEIEEELSYRNTKQAKKLEDHIDALLNNLDP